MIEIDGAQKSGSGTIVRYGVSLASILGKDIHMTNIRAKRKRPGLQMQHLKTIQACCRLTGGSVEDAELDSYEIRYLPGGKIRGGEYSWDIGTAGSTTLMSQCLLPLGLFADSRSVYTISGGLFQDFAPNAFHMKHVIMKLLRGFSASADIDIIRPGYYPKGSGTIKVVVDPVRNTLSPLRLTEQGKVTEIKGVALSSHLDERQVSRRMADTCLKVLARAGYRADIEIVNDTSAIQRGAALFIYAVTDTGCIIGADMAGKLGRTAEEIGRRVAKDLVEDIKSGATVDRHTADQLILYAALAEGESEYVIPRMTEHVDSNIWLVQEMLGAKAFLYGRNLRVRGIGLKVR